MITLKNVMLGVGMFSMLAGCSVFSPVKVEEPKTYVLDAVSHTTLSTRKHVSVYVAPIDASAVYNTANMAYTLQPYQVAYFAKNSWAEAPAMMLRPLIVDALGRAHIRASQSALVNGYNYILTMQLVELQQDFYHHPTTLRFVVRAQLLNGAANRSVAEKEFAIDQPMAANTPYAGVVAANLATQEFLTELTRFCIQHI
jgi:cholesterol transport system auxiliary component